MNCLEVTPIIQLKINAFELDSRLLKLDFTNYRKHAASSHFKSRNKPKFIGFVSRLGLIEWSQENLNKKFFWQKGPKCAENLKILLIMVTHMASCNLQSGPNVLFLNWVTRVASRDFKQFIWQKVSKCRGKLKISLIKVSHLTSCNLRNLYLEVWNLVQMYYFWIGSLEQPERSSNK